MRRGSAYLELPASQRATTTWICISGTRMCPAASGAWGQREAASSSEGMGGAAAAGRGRSTGR
jgi:hypothetical protein